MLIAFVQPDGQCFTSLVGGLVGLGIGLFAERGLDETLGLTMVFWRVRLGTNVFDA